MSMLAAALFGLIVVTIGIDQAWRRLGRRREAVSSGLPDLAHALRQVDLFGDTTPALHIQADGEVGEIAESANHLLTRLEQYKVHLQARDRRMRRLLGNITDVLFQVDANLRLTWVTGAVENVLGYSAEQMCGRRLNHFVVNFATTRGVLSGRVEINNHPLRVYRGDGSVAWLLVSARVQLDADGCFLGLEGSFCDGTELIEAENALFIERERAQTTLASIGDSVITTRTDGTIDYMNDSAQVLIGENRRLAQGRHFGAVCCLRDNRTGKVIQHLIENCIDTGHSVHLHSEAALHNVSQRRDFSVRVNVSPIRDSLRGVIGTVVVLHDITELHELSQQMRHQATHDGLTGLANRGACERELRDLLVQAGLDNTMHALCYLDLDQFKIVNDTCGHAAGDRLLCDIAEQLAGEIRQHDTIARIGGDEFGVLLRDTTLEQAANTAERMCRRVEDFRFYWHARVFRVGVSIGLVPVTSDSGQIDEVLSDADTACYIAKENGRNRVHVHTPGGDEVSNRHSDMRRMQRISEAIDRNDFRLFAQEIRPLDWQPGECVCLECLVRLRTDDGTLLRPDAFLPVAERYHIMSQIDRWVLENALDIIAHSPSYAGRVCYFTINLSAQSMTDEYFIDFVLDVLRRTRVDPSWLVFEITETSAITNFSRATRLMRVLRDQGCRFALDDFGSGLSSFSYLKNLPLDFIKIDGSFVRDVCTDPVDLETVRAINRVGHTMGLRTIAEHVESEDVLEELGNVGVDFVQGYHIDRPMPFAQWSPSHLHAHNAEPRRQVAS